MCIFKSEIAPSRTVGKQWYAEPKVPSQLCLMMHLRLPFVKLSAMMGHSLVEWTRCPQGISQTLFHLYFKD